MIPKILVAVSSVVVLALLVRNTVTVVRKERRGEPIPPDPMDGMIQPVPGPNDIPSDPS